jgi:signal peptidase I
LNVDFKKLWRNEHFQTAFVIGLIALTVFGFWYGSQAVLNTQFPALAVVSGSMCIPYDGACDGRFHPFARTLHIGDLIIVQGVNPADLNANYPDSDIIVFYKTNRTDELIVHRIVNKEERNGKIYFWTKGDGNGNKWPIIPQTAEYDPWGPISQDQVVGKFVMRIPWLGHVVLFMRNSLGLPIVIALIIIIVIVEFIIPLLRNKKPSKQQIKVQQQP